MRSKNARAPSFSLSAVSELNSTATTRNRRKMIEKRAFSPLCILIYHFGRARNFHMSYMRAAVDVREKLWFYLNIFRATPEHHLWRTENRFGKCVVTFLVLGVSSSSFASPSSWTIKDKPRRCMHSNVANKLDRNCIHKLIVISAWVHKTLCRMAKTMLSPRASSARQWLEAV